MGSGSLGVLRSSETQLWGHLSLMLLVILNITLGQAKSVLYWGSHNTSHNTPCLPVIASDTRSFSEQFRGLLLSPCSSLRGLIFPTFVLLASGTYLELTS